MPLHIFLIQLNTKTVNYKRTEDLAAETQYGMAQAQFSNFAFSGIKIQDKLFASAQIKNSAPA